MTIRTVLAAAVGLAFVSGVAAQQPAPPPPQQPDFSKAEVKVTDLGNKTFMLEGVGGNITVAAGDDAVIMIDAQFAPMHDKIKAAVDAATRLPIRYVVNTHFHGDHTGGNANFARDGAIVVAHDNIRVRLAAGTLYGALDRLMADGLVEEQGREVVDGRERRYYALTDAGHGVVAEEARRMAASSQAVLVRLDAVRGMA